MPRAPTPDAEALLRFKAEYARESLKVFCHELAFQIAPAADLFGETAPDYLHRARELNELQNGEDVEKPLWHFLFALVVAAPVPSHRLH